jgi:peptidoglycan/LPS O-acetylase OafA/YrhL
MSIFTEKRSVLTRPTSTVDISAPSARSVKSEFTGNPTPSLGYIPSLDGIRAIAVLAVMIFHSAVPWLPGGFLGVDVFFVLSGFLITSLLLQEVERTGGIDFKRFYIRRIRRLVPAFLAVVLVSALLILLFAQDGAGKYREDVLASALYVNNWWNIFGDQSYFEAIGRPPMLQHLWSLAVEEQFYLIWPAVLLFTFRRRLRDGVRRVAIIGVFASTALMAILSLLMSMPGENDPSRLYFGTDTHAMTILAGAALATAWRPKSLPKKLALQPTMVLTAIGVVALALMAWFFVNVTDDSAMLYRGGFLVFAGVCVVVIAVATHPAIAASRVLAIAPMVYIGKRSYGLYLWHWPIFVILRPGIDIGLTGIPALVIQFGLTFAAAELSYRYLEMPVRNGDIGKIWSRWKAQGVALKRAVIACSISIVVVIGLAVGVNAIPAVDSTSYLNGATQVGAGALDAEPADTTISSSESSALKVPDDPLMTAPFVPGEDLTKRPVTAIGDSVMLGAREAVQGALDKVTVDANVSRHAVLMYKRIDQRKNAGKLAPVVVIHPGTNGPAYEDDLREAVAGLSDRVRVVLVTTHVPRSWMDESNSNIRKIAGEFPNVRVAEWAQAAEGHREFFVTDGTHLTPPGGRAYADAIKQAITSP